MIIQKNEITITDQYQNILSIDIDKPWLVMSLYSGQIHVLNVDDTQEISKPFGICDLPVRAAKFIVRKKWIITGSDDKQIRIFNYNTCNIEPVHMFNAHSDKIRSIAVHPIQPYILTSSDDKTIKLWDWEKAWECKQVFKDHEDSVMQIVFNPKDNNTFASASLDKTVKVWQLGSQTPNFTFVGHEKGVNCVDYYYGSDKSYLMSGGDDHLVKIWDYQNKTCVQTLEVNAQNISCVAFHPELPIIMSGTKEGSVHFYNVDSFRYYQSIYASAPVCLIQPLNYVISNECFVVYENTVMQLIINQHLLIDNKKNIVINDKNKIFIKDSNNEFNELKIENPIFIEKIMFNIDFSMLAIMGDGFVMISKNDKIIYDEPSNDFAWSLDPNVCAMSTKKKIRIAMLKPDRVEVIKTFNETDFLSLHSGYHLGIQTSGIQFFDWATPFDKKGLVPISNEETPNLYWSNNGKTLVIGYNNKLEIYKQTGELVNTIKTDILSGIWLNNGKFFFSKKYDILFYDQNTNCFGKLQSTTQKRVFLKVYIEEENAIYFSDNNMKIEYITLSSN